MGAEKAYYSEAKLNFPPEVSSHLFLIFIVGTAGSGKSFLTAAFSDWLKLKRQEVISVNLDPGVLNLPYTPDVDVREYVSIEKLMDQYSLGPNGALIMAADLVATEIEAIREDVEEFNADYVLIDTPGQMELFAYRSSGTYLTHVLSGDEKSMVFLADSIFLNKASASFPSCCSPIPSSPDSRHHRSTAYPRWTSSRERRGRRA
jgi:GTPase SAR1 family protein